jgi:hypothetical protein
MPEGRQLLVGGWYLRRNCRPALRPDCPAPVLANAQLERPAAGYMSTDWIALDRRLNKGGAHVVRVITEDDPRCAIRRRGECQLRLRIVEVVWSTDEGDPDQIPL